MKSVDTLLRSMRSGHTQSEEEIAYFVRAATDGTMTRAQIATWLAWAFQRGLNTEETIALTRAMTQSGTVMTWPEGAPLIDKHSTGGVGDKVSLVLAPLWAELGYRVPMISGRGLGHTAGTLDKLEAIPGFRTDLSDGELHRVLKDVGCFISGQTATLAPADRILYALRNETQTVESIPLIVGSILSKKLAEGVAELVLDVKTGSGAFMETLSDAQRLARSLVDVATGAGLRCSATISEMGRPLGEMVGHSLEVQEAVECLKGEGPEDLRELVVTLAGHPNAAETLASGRAFTRFQQMVAAQGGDPKALERTGALGDSGVDSVDVVAPKDGIVSELNARALGVSLVRLGGGRIAATDAIDFGVGIQCVAKPGESVCSGDLLARIYHRDRKGLDEAVSRITDAYVVLEAESRIPPLIHEVVTA